MCAWTVYVCVHAQTDTLVVLFRKRRKTYENELWQTVKPLLCCSLVFCPTIKIRLH